MTSMRFPRWYLLKLGFKSRSAGTELRVLNHDTVSGPSKSCIILGNSSPLYQERTRAITPEPSQIHVKRPLLLFHTSPHTQRDQLRRESKTSLPLPDHKGIKLAVWENSHSLSTVKLATEV